MDIQKILSYVYFGLGSLALIAGLIARFKKSKKDKGTGEAVRETLVDVGELLVLIAEAETHKNFTGADKLDYVLTRGLPKFEGTADELTDIINNLVAFTKNVNANTTTGGGDNDDRGTSNSVNRIAR